jgi:hypothetical protein
VQLIIVIVRIRFRKLLAKGCIGLRIFNHNIALVLVASIGNHFFQNLLLSESSVVQSFGRNISNNKLRFEKKISCFVSRLMEKGSR